MDSLAMITGLDDAIKTLRKASSATASGSLAIWLKVDHAIAHLDRQVKDLMAAPAEPTYVPPTMDEWWAIVDRLNSSDIGAATLEGGGAACTFIMIETNEGMIVNLGDVNETWTADLYQSLGDWQNGSAADSFDLEIPTSNRNAADIACAYRLAWTKVNA